MRFADPWFLVALAALPFWIRHYITSKPALNNSVRFSDTAMITRLLHHGRPVGAHAGFIFRVVAVTLIIFALARPQTGVREEEYISRGIDIMLTLDLSSSMSATDLAPNRLAAAKKVLVEFIGGRKNDRIGLVVFSAQGYTQCPLTLDYPILLDFLDNSYIGLIEDGTAIGMALATAANRLKDSDAKSRIAILLTDGVNNRGSIDPMTAAKMAKSIGVRVYTIGVGREGTFLQTVQDPVLGARQVRVRTQIDEKLLRNIAAITGGRYYRAEDSETLLDIYKRIDKLEKTDMKTTIHVRHTDWFMWLLAAALAALTAELAIPATRWRMAP